MNEHYLLGTFYKLSASNFYLRYMIDLGCFNFIQGGLFIYPAFFLSIAAFASVMIILKVTSIFF